MSQANENSANRESFTVFTVGHSNLSYAAFLDLMHQHKIDAIADVRSFPHSTNFPQFNGEQLNQALRRDGIVYAFLGSQLGGRPKSPSLYKDGVADYEKMATTAEFETGINRVVEAAKRYRLALMCSEHDPIDCHRCLLVSRALWDHRIQIEHIFRDGHKESQKEIETHLLQLAKLGEDDLFTPMHERISEAYRERALKIAFRLDEDSKKQRSLR